METLESLEGAEIIAVNAYNDNILTAIFGMKAFEFYDLNTEDHIYTYLHTKSRHFVYIKFCYTRYVFIEYVAVESVHIFDNNEHATKKIDVNEFVLKLGKELSKKL